MSDREQILSLAQAFVLARLQDRVEVFIPCIGRFQSRFHEEYILREDNRRTLMPPRVSLAFSPSDYLLTSHRYTQLDFELPRVYFYDDFISDLSLLYELDPQEVREALEEYTKEVLKDLFSGKRVAFMALGEFFVSEEVAGILLLNFTTDSKVLKSLNYPFDPYKPTLLNERVDFPDTKEMDKPADVPERYQFAITSTKQAEVDTARPTEEVKVASEVNEPTVETPVAVSSSAEHLVRPRKQSSLPYILVALLLIVGVALFLLLSTPRGGEAKPIIEPQVASPISVPDSIAIAIEQPHPSDPANIDTLQVARGSSLAQLARQYYHNVYYWVYIYMANKDSIPDPNNLIYGQRLVIPSLDAYELKEDSLEALHEAKAWATIIQNRRFESYKEQRKSIQLP